MKSLAFVLAALLPIAQASAQTVDAKKKSLIEDCKYVSLNNAIRMAHAIPGTKFVQMSPKSQESGYRENKTQIIVLKLNGQENTAAGFQFDLDDPESGRCFLRDGNEKSIKRLTDAEVAALKVIPDIKDPPPGTPEVFWKDCNVNAVNTALAEWAKKTPASVPLVGYSSYKQGKGELTYGIILSDANKQLIKENPNHSASQLGQVETGEQLITLRAVESPTGCTISK